MGTGTNLGNLSSGEWDRLQQFADRLETAWQHANATAANVDFRPLLPPATDPLHVEVLHEFVKIDMEARWRRGQGIPLEQYLQQYPTLGPAATLAARLIYEEYRVRRRYGDNPPLAAYANRFPNQFSELERLLQAEPVPDPLTSSAPTLPAPPPDLGDVFREGDILHLDGSYKLVRRIGRGSFGEVWQAEAPGGVEVAAKILKGKIALDEAKRELQALGLIRRLRHVYLLPLHAYWLQQYQLVIVMELCDGSLRARMEECQRRGKPGIPPPELTRYIAEAADALDYLHERNVLHRDIKPENLLYLSRHVQVADFGLARVFEQTRGLVTTSGCGTPAFIAPEVFWQGKVGPHSDQYSLAAAYVELRLGRALFPSHNWSQLMKDHLEKTPDLKPLPDAEQEVLLRALAKDKNDRYPKCSEFAGQLQAAVQLEQ